mmetsp:Transcript_117626/g.332764  ORF Transcript_117626/g.332764 Transcript_117626/m.332764 type:complete len:278 (+) Transcript_117626:857-1690(+)
MCLSPSQCKLSWQILVLDGTHQNLRRVFFSSQAAEDKARPIDAVATEVGRCDEAVTQLIHLFHNGDYNLALGVVRLCHAEGRGSRRDGRLFPYNVPVFFGVVAVESNFHFRAEPLQRSGDLLLQAFDDIRRAGCTEFSWNVLVLHSHEQVILGKAPIVPAEDDRRPIGGGIVVDWPSKVWRSGGNPTMITQGVQHSKHSLAPWKIRLGHRKRLRTTCEPRVPPSDVPHLIVIVPLLGDARVRLLEGCCECVDERYVLGICTTKIGFADVVLILDTKN